MRDAAAAGARSTATSSRIAGALPASGRRYAPGVDLDRLDTLLADRGEPRFRSRQVWEWAARGAGGYDEMSNLPRPLRESLARELPFSTLTLETERQASDGTVKALF